jgi:diacylglycerol kinase family enzyme
MLLEVGSWLVWCWHSSSDRQVYDEYKYAVVINQNSGSVTDKLRADQEFELRASSVDYIFEFAEGKAMASTTTRLVSSGCNALIAGGVDRTIGAMAKVAQTHNLPFETLNHFAKDLHLPTDTSELMKMYENPSLADIDNASVNTHIFLNNSSIGIYPN